MKNFSKILLIMALLFFCVSGIVLAQNDPKNIIFVNNTGYKITEIQVFPSKDKYPKNNTICSFQNLNVTNTGIYSFDLPEQLKQVDTFDVIIKSKGKKFKAKSVIEIQNHNEQYKFDLSTQLDKGRGKLIGGILGAVFALLVITGLAISFKIRGIHWVTWFLRLIGLTAMAWGLISLTAFAVLSITGGTLIGHFTGDVVYLIIARIL